jgi:hypothetical protein
MIRRTLGRGATVVIAVGSALALATAPAFAVVSGTTNNVDTVSATSDADPDNIAMSCLAGQAAVNGIPAIPVLACGVVKKVQVGDSGGSDTVNLFNVTTAFPALTKAEINVDDGGADFVTGSAGHDEIAADFVDTVNAGAGNDRIDGGDTVDGGDGDDLIVNPDGSAQGGPGNDRVVDPSSGPIDGGPGNDSVEFNFIDTTTDLGLTFVLADSGLTISAPTVTPVTLPATNLEQWIITMTDGPSSDLMDSRTYSGRMVFRALDGNDTFLGGAGPDYVDGGTGNDSLTPGGGSDAVHGGEGNDTVNVRDGVADVVDCGGGTDSVTADRSDAVTNCESVSLPAPETDKIAGPKKVTKGEKATFTFGSSTAGATFECQVDKGAFKACSSPFKVKTKKLKTGKHTLSVRAVQPAGNADATPSTFKFKVVAKK